MVQSFNILDPIVFNVQVLEFLVLSNLFDLFVGEALLMDGYRLFLRSKVSRFSKSGRLSKEVSPESESSR